MGDPDYPRPHRSVGRCLGAADSQKYFRALLSWFGVTQENGWLLSDELRSGRGLHAFLGHLNSGVDPSPGQERLELLGVDRDETVHTLH